MLLEILPRIRITFACLLTVKTQGRKCNSEARVSGRREVCRLRRHVCWLRTCALGSLESFPRGWSELSETTIPVSLPDGKGSATSPLVPSGHEDSASRMRTSGGWLCLQPSRVPRPGGREPSSLGPLSCVHEGHPPRADGCSAQVRQVGQHLATPHFVLLLEKFLEGAFLSQKLAATFMSPDRNCLGKSDVS